MLSDFGKMLGKFRLDHDLTMGGLAKAMGWSVSAISALEQGRMIPSENFLNDLFLTFSVTPEEQEEFKHAAAKAGTPKRMQRARRISVEDAIKCLKQSELSTQQAPPLGRFAALNFHALKPHKNAVAR